MMTLLIRWRVRLLLGVEIGRLWRRLVDRGRITSIVSGAPRRPDLDSG
jgi:hypothetical protein